MIPEDILIPRWFVILCCALALSTCVSRPIQAQNTGALMPNVQPTFYNASGSAVNSLGFVCTTVSGGTTALLTYQDSALTTANQDPIRLNAAGRAVNGSTEVSIYLQPGNAYRVTVYAAGTGNTCNGVSVGTLLRQIDPVYDLAQLIFNPKDYRLFKTTAGYFVERTSDGTILGSDPADAAAALSAFFTAVGPTLFYNNMQTGPFPGGVTLHCSPTIAPASAAAYNLGSTVAIPPTQNFILDCPNTTWQQGASLTGDVFTVDSCIDSTFNFGIISTGAANLTGAGVRFKPVTVGPDGLTTINICFANVLAVAGPGDAIVFDGTGNGAVNNSVFSLQECNLPSGTNRRCYTFKGGTNGISNNLVNMTFENMGGVAVRIDANTNITSNFITLNATNNNFTVDDQQSPSLNVITRYLGNSFGGPKLSFAVPAGLTTQSASGSGVTVSIGLNSGGVNGIYSNVVGGGSQVPFVFNVANNEAARIDPVANRFLFGLTSTDVGGNTTFLSGINIVQTGTNSPLGQLTAGGTGVLLRSNNSNVGFIPNILIQPGLTTALVLGTSGAVATGTGTLPAGQGSLNVSGTLTYAGVATSNTGDFLCINNVTQIVTQGTTCTLSSERYKHDFEPLDAGLDTVLRIPTFSYIRNDHPEMGRQIGLKAEAMAAIEPRVVLLDREGKPSTVLYENYTAILTKAIQELEARVRHLEAR